MDPQTPPAPPPDLAPGLAATDLLFRTDAYLDEAEATIIATIGPTLILDRSLFYAASGGQPSDHGEIRRMDGASFPVGEALRYLDPAKTILGINLPDGEDAASWRGARVTMVLDTTRRLKLMRMHSALHLLSVALPYPVTGGSIGTEEGRLDFDIPDAGQDKEEITASLNALIHRNAEILDRWITDAELDANPGLVKTMKVQPPRGAGRVRLVEIDGIDLQPCGGTHVRNTREIGPMLVTSIEKKGKQNRRVRIAFA
jgi:misacylated tRNA(Ala) deacylase